MATDTWYTRHESDSRITNAEDGKKYYRWVVQVKRHNIRKASVGMDKWKAIECGGTVITDRQENLQNAFNILRK